MREETRQLVSEIRASAHPLTDAAIDYDPLLELIGDARFVLIGEASHGTHEFYKERAQITRRLIEEKGFNAVAAEADWPDAYGVNRFVHGNGATAVEALDEFKRFPSWMWRNADVLDFVGWLREHNQALPQRVRKAGFYGLDLYSLFGSMEAVIDYLERVDPEAAKCARYRYSCFDHVADDPQAYGYAASFGIDETCEDEVMTQLKELQRQAADYLRSDGFVAEDEFFFAEQNARVAKNAEQYYRSMFQERISSWNLRDRHMAETLEALVAHLDRHGGRSKVVIWAHNSHIGDARATEMGQSGELNIGQLVRERYGKDAVLVGFTTYTGSVSAASSWGGPVERKRVRPALPGSYEDLFHRVGIARFLFTLRDSDKAAQGLRERRLERAIGVIYLPQSERVSHYFYARLPNQFDVVIHIDETRAVEPLERTADWVRGEVPETYPSAL
ncbi:MAG: hypothetical protein KatS3mg057_1065 [Herpetosiphonaceae bacterium]|nr:MAG: hypothetical protein KatS3mg057_1065 [Herpetosiphonaceae bacterium]